MAGRQAASALSQSINIPPVAAKVPIEVDSTSAMELSDFLAEVVLKIGDIYNVVNKLQWLSPQIHTAVEKCQSPKQY